MGTRRRRSSLPLSTRRRACADKRWRWYPNEPCILKIICINRGQNENLQPYLFKLEDCPQQNSKTVWLHYPVILRKFSTDMLPSHDVRRGPKGVVIYTAAANTKFCVSAGTSRVVNLCSSKPYLLVKVFLLLVPVKIS